MSKMFMGYPIIETDMQWTSRDLEIQAWEGWERDQIIAFVESEFPGCKVSNAVKQDGKWVVTVAGVDPDIVSLTMVRREENECQQR